MIVNECNYGLKHGFSKTPAKTKRTKTRGQAAVEFAVTMPFFVLLIFGIFECGRLMYTKHMIDTATREGARAGVVMLNADDAITVARNIATTLLTQQNLNDAVVSAAMQTVNGIDMVRVTANFVYQPTRVFPAVTLTSVTVMRKEG